MPSGAAMKPIANAMSKHAKRSTSFRERSSRADALLWRSLTGGTNAFVDVGNAGIHLREGVRLLDTHSDRQPLIIEGEGDGESRTIGRTSLEAGCGSSAQANR